MISMTSLKATNNYHSNLKLLESVESNVLVMCYNYKELLIKLFVTETLLLLFCQNHETQVELQSK